MNLKSLSRSFTNKVGRQVLTVKAHSPVMLFGAGLVGVTATAVLACRATLKMSDILAESEEKLNNLQTKIDADGENDVLEKTKFSVKLQTAIKVAKNYAPAVIVGVVSVGALTGSHVILRKRNAGLAAAYAIVDKGFKDYRGRVIADQGEVKDLEYRFGKAEREIVEEGPNGPETRVIKGLDQNEVKKATEWTYARVFDEYNPNWNATVDMQNQFFVNLIQNQANDLLRANGHIFLNEVYELLGFKKTPEGQLVGWVYNPESDADGYVDFGVWTSGKYKGVEWINGNKDAILLDFNVDGSILQILADQGEK